MILQELESYKRQMSKMTPRVIQAKEKKESPSNPQQKVFVFSNKEQEKKEVDNGGLSAEELEKLLLDRTDELDELKEQYETLEAENDELKAQNEEDMEYAQKIIDE